MSHKILKPLSIEERADFIVEYNHNQGLLIEETETAMYALEPWEKLKGDEVIDNTEAWKAEQAQKERERIAMLSLTRGDVFRGLLIAKGVTRLMLREMIETNEQLTEVQKEMALIDFDEALNFYRGNALIDTVGLALGITSEQLDKFFEFNDYTYLIPSEPVEDTSKDTSEQVTDQVSDQVEVQDENTTDTTESDIQDELDTTASKSGETNTDILE